MPGQPDPVRSEGPSTVTEGDASVPKIIVLDPAWAGKHDELPATWRPLTEHRQVVWCRLPAGGALTDADDVLGDAGPDDPDIDIVASGPFAAEALQLAERHPGVAKHLLLVDPASDAFLPAEDAPEANDDWIAEHDGELAGLRDAGTQVKVIAQSSPGPADRVPAPLPLGHPDVVAAVRTVLADV